MAAHTTAGEDRIIEALDCDDADVVSDIVDRLDRMITERDERIQELEQELEAETDRAKDLESRLEQYES